jgi:hypothetical protein
MSPYQCLASASLAAAVALAAAACGSTPAPQPPATSSSTTPSATSSSTTPPATSSSTAPPANSAYIYEPEGVTYNGEGGTVETFSIPAGTYSLNQQASYDPANDPDGTGECLFGGELDYLSGSGGTIPLGNGGVPIPAQVPIDGPPSTAPYPAGATGSTSTPAPPAPGRSNSGRITEHGYADRPAPASALVDLPDIGFLSFTGGCCCCAGHGSSTRGGRNRADRGQVEVRAGVVNGGLSCRPGR